MVDIVDPNQHCSKDSTVMSLKFTVELLRYKFENNVG